MSPWFSSPMMRKRKFQTVLFKGHPFNDPRTSLWALPLMSSMSPSSTSVGSTVGVEHPWYSTAVWLLMKPSHWFSLLLLFLKFIMSFIFGHYNITMSFLTSLSLLLSSYTSLLVLIQMHDLFSHNGYCWWWW